ncbi:MAG: glycosyltransferase [Candidatus Omnitrophota bacterium]
MAKVDPDVAIVVPILNEEATIVRLLVSFETLTLYPKEVILVDGGSKDRTVECINRYLEAKKLPYELQVMVLPKALPGRGRNEGIRKTQCPLVACTDAGGHVDPSWLEDLTSPLKEDPACDMVVGNCRPAPSSFFERCTFYVTIESSFRKQFIFFGGASIAFRRTLWEKVGGYPETLYPCEDKAFLRKVKEGKFLVRLSERALIYWRSRPHFWDFLKQYFLYGRGDGEGGFVPHRYFLRALFYGILFVFLSQGRIDWMLVFLLGYLGFLTIKAFLVLKDLRVFLVLPVLFLVKDFSQLFGYVVGKFRRLRGTD